MRTNRLIAGLGLLLGLLTMASGARAQWFNDTFVGTPNTSILGHVSDSGATWTTGVGNSITGNGTDNLQFALYSGVKYIYTANPSKVFYPNVLPTSNEYDINFTLLTANNNSGAAGDIRFVARYNPTAGTGYVFQVTMSGATITRTADPSGVITQLGIASGNYATALALGTTHTFKIVVRDAIKAIYLDGSATPVCSTTDNLFTNVGYIGTEFNTSAGVLGNAYYIASLSASYPNTTLVAPVISVPTVGNTNAAAATRIGLSLLNPAAGRPPYAFQWQRGTASGAETNVSGMTAQNPIDTGLTPSTLYYYRCVVTDANAATVTSNEVSATTTAAIAPDAVIIGYLGDSITQQAASFATYTSVLGSLTGKQIVTVNCGISGYTTLGWTPLQPYFLQFLAVLQTFQAKYVSIMIGTNDGGIGLIAASSFQTNLAQIVTALTGAGYKVILNYPPFRWDAAFYPYLQTDALIGSYQPMIDGLVNGATVFQGDQIFFGDTAAGGDNSHAATLLDSTNLHPNAAGQVKMQTRWANAFYKAIYAKTGRGRRLN